jgi:hypothetical protein
MLLMSPTGTFFRGQHIIIIIIIIIIITAFLTIHNAFSSPDNLKIL